MKVEFFKTLWGHTGPYADAARAAVRAGFSGLEGPIPRLSDSRREFLDALKENQLRYIGEISTTGFAVPDPGAGVQEHLDAFERILTTSLEAEPIFFTAMAGSDLWEFKDSVAFLTEAWETAQRYGVRIGFETHRSRSLFHPVITRALLAELPPIELTLDFSHWCNVCERLVLDELPDVLELCAARALHVQPRVGWDQGAQVADPRLPRFAGALDAHLRWWRVVWDAQMAGGCETITMTPEFGPDGYEARDFSSGEPLVDLWEINVWMAERIRQELQIGLLAA